MKHLERGRLVDPATERQSSDFSPVGNGMTDRPGAGR